jgi:hypothetical protein
LNTSINFFRKFAMGIAHTHDMHRCQLIVQAIDFTDFLRTQYLLKSPTGKSRE